MLLAHQSTLYCVVMHSMLEKMVVASAAVAAARKTHHMQPANLFLVGSSLPGPIHLDGFIQAPGFDIWWHIILQACKPNS